MFYSALAYRAFGFAVAQLALEAGWGSRVYSLTLVFRAEGVRCRGLAFGLLLWFSGDAMLCVGWSFLSDGFVLWVV